MLQTTEYNVMNQCQVCGAPISKDRQLICYLRLKVVKIKSGRLSSVKNFSSIWLLTHCAVFLLHFIRLHWQQAYPRGGGIQRKPISSPLKLSRKLVSERHSRISSIKSLEITRICSQEIILLFWSPSIYFNRLHISLCDSADDIAWIRFQAQS